MHLKAGCLEASFSPCFNRRLCSARGNKLEPRSNEAALAERRASNGAASSSQSSSHGLNLRTASCPDKTQPHSIPCEASLPESFHQKLTPQDLSGLQSQRSHRGTIDTCPSNIPSDINLPEQVSSPAAAPRLCCMSVVECYLPL